SRHRCRPPQATSAPTARAQSEAIRARGGRGCRRKSELVKPGAVRRMVLIRACNLASELVISIARLGAGQNSFSLRAICLGTYLPVPTANQKRVTASANRLILAPGERSLQVDLVAP